MSSSEPTVRYRHISLPSQQRRLRHLRSVAVRNITQRKTGKNDELHGTETFFTLHKDSQSSAFYTSERIEGTLNPTWRSFHLNRVSENPLQHKLITAQTYCVIRVWRAQKTEVSLCIEWSVHLDGLVYLGSKSQRDGLHFPSNTILFEMMEGVYSLPLSPPQWDPGKDKLQVEVASVRKSYSTQTLLRIKTVMRAIKQTQASVQRVKNSIEGQLHHSLVLDNKRSMCEFQVLKNNLMRSDLEWRIQRLRQDRELLQTLQAENSLRESKLRDDFTKQQGDRSQLHEKKKKYFDVREDLKKTGEAMVIRKKELITELAFIYPIAEPNPNQYTICAVRLPDSEDFAGQDEVMIAVALGYTCHLVEMISRFLDVPLRYPMRHLGSRSVIVDHIIDKLAEREREFPLYSKGRAKFQFNYGVYLLNKNIAQLRYYCALATNDLRLTLSNLKSLLVFRLGVKFERANAPVLAGQHTAVPPNLGGPQRSSNPMYGTHVTELRTGSNSPQSIRSQSPVSILSDQDEVAPAVASSDSSENLLDGSPDGDVVEGDTVVSGNSESSQIDSRHSTKSSHENNFITEDNKQNKDVKHSTKPPIPVKPNKMAVTRNFSAPAKTKSQQTPSPQKQAAAYNSRFKMWQSHISASFGENTSESSSPSKLSSDFVIVEPVEPKDAEEPVTTFKTRGLTTPTSPPSALVPSNDLIASLEAADRQPSSPTKPALSPTKPAILAPKPTIVSPKPTLPVAGAFQRDRKDSDTDNDSATFVIPNSTRTIPNSSVIK